MVIVIYPLPSLLLAVGLLMRVLLLLEVEVGVEEQTMKSPLAQMKVEVVPTMEVEVGTEAMMESFLEVEAEVEPMMEIFLEVGVEVGVNAQTLEQGSSVKLQVLRLEELELGPMKPMHLRTSPSWRRNLMLPPLLIVLLPCPMVNQC